MSTEMVHKGNGESMSHEIAEKVLLGGDLSKMTPADRIQYYKAVCESVGLNPLTQPFDYLHLNGKTQLYAKRNCTDQLRKINHVSVVSIESKEANGLYIVICQVKDSEGRIDASTGAVPIANLKGEALANAIMKAESKAKRRATLSLCGLSFLDESEVSSVPGATPIEPVRITQSAVPAPTDAPQSPPPPMPTESKIAYLRKWIPVASEWTKSTPEERLRALRAKIDHKEFGDEVAKELGVLWFVASFSIASLDGLASLWDEVEKQEFNQEQMKTLEVAHKKRWDQLNPDDENEIPFS